MMNEYNDEFWALLDKLFEDYEVEIDRPKGSPHPRYLDYIYPLDYGFLKGTASSDGDGIDVWMGSSQRKCVTAIISSVDVVKGDSEIKILYACTKDELEMIYRHHNRNDGMKGILTVREDVN